MKNRKKGGHANTKSYYATLLNYSIIHLIMINEKTVRNLSYQVIRIYTNFRSSLSPMFFNIGVLKNV